jgi:hypothetical protein
LPEFFRIIMMTPRQPTASKAGEVDSGTATKEGLNMPVLSPASPWLKVIPLT